MSMQGAITITLRNNACLSKSPGALFQGTMDKRYSVFDLGTCTSSPLLRTPSHSRIKRVIEDSVWHTNKKRKILKDLDLFLLQGDSENSDSPARGEMPGLLIASRVRSPEGHSPVIYKTFRAESRFILQLLGPLW